MSHESKSMERKTIEKNRRNQMKYLCYKLVSLIPPHHSNPQKGYLSQYDQIGKAADYIKKLSATIEDLKEKKAQVLSNCGSNSTRKRAQNTSGSELLPVVRVKDLGSSLEVALISGLEKKIMVHQVIRLLDEEGAEVISVSLSNSDQKIFLILHAQVKIARIGVDISRMCGKLEELIC